MNRLSPIPPLKLAQPALRALKALGIAKLDDFVRFTEEDISSLHGIGNTAMVEIKTQMKKSKLKFR